MAVKNYGLARQQSSFTGGVVLMRTELSSIYENNFKKLPDNRFAKQCDNNFEREANHPFEKDSWNDQIFLLKRVVSF